MERLSDSLAQPHRLSGKDTRWEVSLDVPHQIGAAITLRTREIDYEKGVGNKVLPLPHAPSVRAELSFRGKIEVSRHELEAVWHDDLLTIYLGAVEAGS